VKMQGLGNDFVVFDAVRQAVELDAQRVRKIADRHFGVGCDQILLVEPPRLPGADFAYRIFNADGSEVAQCGNGARCFARFVREQGLSSSDRLVVDTTAGRMILELQDGGDVTVNMGIPKHAPEEVPLVAPAERSRYTLTVTDELVSFGAVSIGNPHAVLAVPDVEAAPVTTLGPVLECHAVFPLRANIGFMQILDRSRVRLRVFERGTGETLACGSGACAAVVVGIEWGQLDPTVSVELPGGSLQVSWAGRGSPVLMTGPALTVFRGEMEL
jgi:diaminopimelate epimerase